MDPDPEGPKTCGSAFGSGSATLVFVIQTLYRLVQVPQYQGVMFSCELKLETVRSSVVEPELNEPNFLPWLNQNQNALWLRNRIWIRIQHKTELKS